MQVRELTIRGFRGIEELSWKPGGSLVCLLGHGDVGKSTLLDAIELALTPRQPAFSDTDFSNADTRQSIEITVTVGELSSESLDDRRFGLYTRGWTAAGDLHDEPVGADEPVVTVKLVVDASLEGDWTLHTDRREPRVLSPRDRALFGVVRLGSEIERHFTWARGTALSQLTVERDAAAGTLAEAFRSARDAVAATGLPMLAEVSQTVAAGARKLGAYGREEYRAGLDTQRAAMSLSGIALHDGVVPVRMAGLGTRRLAALAIQRASVPAGAIVLVDEIEHGLEPHRIRHTLKVLRDAVDPATAVSGSVGQVLLTTHSPTTLVELGCQHLAVCSRRGGRLEISTPSEELQALLRRDPDAFLARRLLVCEGPTELGLARGMRDTWNQRQPMPFEARGAWLANGGGMPNMLSVAKQFAALGYAVAILCDADVPIPADESHALAIAGVSVFQWTQNVSTEMRVLRDVSWRAVQQLMDAAYEAKSEQSVLSQVAAALSVPNVPGPKLSDWRTLGLTNEQLRDAIAVAAASRTGSWFKSIGGGESLGYVVGPETVADPTTSLARVLANVEAWLYGE